MMNSTDEKRGPLPVAERRASVDFCDEEGGRDGHGFAEIRRDPGLVAFVSLEPEKTGAAPFRHRPGRRRRKWKRRHGFEKDERGSGRS